MSDSLVVYRSPLNDYKIVVSDGLWGIIKRNVVEHWNGCFWESIFDGGGSLRICFTFLWKMNIISNDEKKLQVKKWCK